MPNRCTPQLLRKGLMACLLLAITSYGGLQLWWLYNAKRFQEVRPGVLYRLGQPTESGMRYVIERENVRTVITLQSFMPTLRKHGADFGQPDGPDESEFARSMNVRYEHWPLGDEKCWPWPAPWHLEEFLKLIDDPANWPVLIHCQGGRHRTGTLSAIFRLEYDRWPVERVLKEMYSFNFGPPVPIQEHNLRTYVPRPRPSNEQWQALKARFFPLLADSAPADYERLVWALRNHRDRAELRAVVGTYLTERQPFALPLTYRLIETTDDPLIEVATPIADRVLHEGGHHFDDWLTAAALIADFGEPFQQQRLLTLLESLREGPVSQRYAAIVAGVTNRFTPNRLPYLRPLLADTRERLEPSAQGTRYCDTAVARMQTILDEAFYSMRGATTWNDARQHAIQWFDKHDREVQLTRLQPPTGRKLARAMRAGDEIEQIPVR